MAWVDEIEEYVFDARFIGRNMIDHLKAKQAMALEWASEDSGETVKPINNKLFFPNVRSVPVFPTFQIVSLSHRTETGEGDVDQTFLTLTYTIALMDGNEDRLARHISIYEMAFSSMARNIPKTSLLKDSKINCDGVLRSYESDIDVSRDAGNSQFLQSLLTSLTWEIDFQNRE